MGIAALRKILSPVPFDPKELAGRTVAVDADNLIWAFATALGATGDFPKAPDGRPMTHLYGLVGRLRVYAGWDVRSAWVFDGVQPGRKDATLIARAERIEAARAAGDMQASIEVTEKDLAECRALLDALGVPNMVAPGESDAQCAHLAESGHAWAAVTQDWDIMLFGAPRALRNLSPSKTRKPELLDLRASLARAGLTRAQLIDAAILIGTDYNEGVAGIGPAKAVAYVKRHGGIEGIRKAMGIEIAEAEEVREIFTRHPVDRSFKPNVRPPDGPKAVKLLTGRGVSEDRARALVEDLQRLHGSTSLQR